MRARECRRGQRATGIDHAGHDGALARSSAELTSHPENCGLTELAATPLARATNPLRLPLLFYSTILPLCQPSRDYTLVLPLLRPEHPIPLQRGAPFTPLLPPPLTDPVGSLPPSFPLVPTAPRAAGIPAASE